MSIRKIKIELILETDNLIEWDDEGQIEWVKNSILKAEDLRLHSNEIGDEFGKITELTKVEFL